MTSQTTSQRHKKQRGWALGLALGAALTLCWTGTAGAATYEEGGGAAVTAQQSHWRWAQQRQAAKRPASQLTVKSLWSLPPSGKKPTIQKKLPSPR